MNKRKVGGHYEQMAAACLIERGYQILEHNYRCRQGEIDLIAKDGAYLVFIEVKFRSCLRNGAPEEAVTVQKQRRIREAARFYLYSHNFGDETPCRFDVVSILGSQLRLIRNAF